VQPDQTASETFDMAMVGMKYLPPAGDGDIVDPYFANALRYDAPTKHYTFIAPETLFSPQIDESTTFTQANLDPTSDLTWTHYATRCNGSVQIYGIDLSLFNFGPTNPELTLQYASIGSYTFGDRKTAPGLGDTVRYFAFGHASTSVQAARTGTAVYTGIIKGFGGQNSMLAKKSFNAIGTLKVTVDFDHQTFNAEIALKGTENGGSYPLTDFGTISFSQNGGSFPGQLKATSASGGKLTAFLAGPSADEIGVAFEASVPDPTDTQRGTARFIGSGAAKR